VPNYWARIPSSPPERRRDEIADICRRHGARLCENETYYGGSDAECWALIRLGRQTDVDALMNELRAVEWQGLVDAHEKARGERPPPSGRRPG
jgi:hypothetical protein